MAVNALDAATDVLERARNLLALDRPSIPEFVRADLRRAALAQGVAALDTYLHWAIRKVAFAEPLPNKLSELPVGFGNLVTMASSSVAARQRKHPDRPQTRARNVLNDKLLKMTFQTPQQVEIALQMLGVAKCWKQLADAFIPPATASDVRHELNRISQRRNKIVHEGDLVRQARPQQIKHEPVTAAEVSADLDWIQSFIKALGHLVG